MKLNAINFEKSNGGMGRALASEDCVSALIFNGLGFTFGTAEGNVKGFDTIATTGSGDSAVTTYAKRFEYLEQLGECGLVYTEKQANSSLTAAQKAMNVVYYHVSEFFRMNSNGVLYVAIKSGSNAVIADDLATVQNYANGAIRQVGVFNSALLDVEGLQTVLTTLEKQHKPMSCVVTYDGADVALQTLTSASLRTKGCCNVSVLIGCDYSTTLVEELGEYVNYGCIGACMGAISKASVHECIAWVQKFPLGLETPALFNGNLIRNVTEANKELLNNNYLFVLTHVGDADCYFNDSHTLDLSTSDYAYIENVRTIDKACRGVYANMLPYLASPLKVDAATGKMSADTVSFLETVAARALEQMETAGELSGYKAEIDPNQNVLATSKLEVVIKQVGVGVMRIVNVKIGFATKI